MADHVAVVLDAAAAQAMLQRVEMVGRAPPMREIAVEAETLVRETFHAERDPWGVAWPQLSPLTLRSRNRRGSKSHQKLLDTGRMYSSLKATSTPDEVRIRIGDGLPDPRAQVHQFGAPNAGRSRNVRIPARPFFPLRLSGPDIPAPWWARLRAPIDLQLEQALR